MALSIFRGRRFHFLPMRPAAHPFHLVDISPWPIAMAGLMLAGALSAAGLLGHAGSAVALPAIILVAALWWRDCLREAAGGYHTAAVQRGLTAGVLLFFLSELMLFLAFFWAFLHAALAPGVELGLQWPPVAVAAIDPLAIPLLGSAVLLTSGFILTGAHAAVGRSKAAAAAGLVVAALMGALFLGLQAVEYAASALTIADGAFGSTFYLTTGLHALHVMAGTIFLAVAAVRLLADRIAVEHHLNLTFAAWYWHLVDVVWLAVFALFYWWTAASVGGGA